MRHGARYSGGGICEFTVWAPFAREVALILEGPSGERSITLKPLERGYWGIAAEGASPGCLYRFSLDGGAFRADPASRFQPSGVGGPSSVIDHSLFDWTDGGWKAPELRDMIIYELHTGTFTPEGTFAAIVPRLDEVSSTGINAIELMPVAQFPGARNWGYDGVFPYAVQNTYGGPEGLKYLVDECHRRGISVIMDVVFNHLGPEGNYLSEFGPYFTERYRTPWGKAVNLDGEYSDEVRGYFRGAALALFEDYHVDGIRLDAVHAIFDFSARPFLKELKEAALKLAAQAGRAFHVIAESDLNDPKLVMEGSLGYGLDCAWCDDFHHSAVAAITGERSGYYADFGALELVAKSIGEGYAYAGEYSGFRKMRFGASSAHVPPERFIVFTQNHDQVGNRMLGDRLSARAPFEALKLAAGLNLLSPYVPLLFMGEEYGEEAPFLYFVDHEDEGLVEAVRKGRKEEFKGFAAEAAEPPDPKGEGTFSRSRLIWESRYGGKGKTLCDFYRELISMRRRLPHFSSFARKDASARLIEGKRVVLMERACGDRKALCFFNFDRSDTEFTYVHRGLGLSKALDSSGAGWGGPGTLMPDEIKGEAALTMRAFGLAVYITG